MSLSRRRALQFAVLSGVSTAGCLSGSGNPSSSSGSDSEPPTETGSTPSPRTESDTEPDTESETPPTTGSETSDGTDSDAQPESVLDLGDSFESSDGTTVTVNSVELYRLVRSTSVGSSTHIDVAWLDGHQFAVTDLDASGPSSELGSEVPIALEVDGTQYPRPDQHWYWTFPPGTHVGETESRRPAYPAPITDATSASIVWVREEPVRWQLPEETVAELTRAPAFEIESLTVPDSVTRGSTFEASFTVRNTGSDGRFVAEFAAGPLSDHEEVTVSVPASDKRTYTKTMDPHYTEHTSSLDVILDWGNERLRRTVTVE